VLTFTFLVFVAAFAAHAISSASGEQAAGLGNGEATRKGTPPAGQTKLELGYARVSAGA
jgi:hypothetical protein